MILSQSALKNELILLEFVVFLCFMYKTGRAPTSQIFCTIHSEIV